MGKAVFSGENQDSLEQEGKADSEKSLRTWAILLKMYCKSRRWVFEKEDSIIKRFMEPDG